MLTLMLTVGLAGALAQGEENNRNACRDLPGHALLKAALGSVIQQGQNGGLGTHVWATVVNREGEVCVVVYTGPNRGAQWPGSRVISAQKANTANNFSLPNLALSTANLYFATQPGGSLYGLQHANVVDTSVIYAGNSSNFGQASDPMVGKKPGGTNVFGGGLALYRMNGELVGAIGVSGETSCADHIIAWKTRDRMGLDYVPAGVAGPAGRDNMIHDLTRTANGELTSPSGFGHAACSTAATAIVQALPNDFPLSTPQP